jgi:uncharacterized membrane protein
MSFILAMLIGVMAGLRTMTAPAAVSWAAYFGWLPVQDTALAFLAYRATPYILTVLVVVELVADKLPFTPSRKRPGSFGVRLISGGLSGAAIGTSGGSTATLVAGLAAGVAGAAIGTLAGYDLRIRLAKALGRDLPAALIEDAVAVGGACLIVGGVS